MTQTFIEGFRVPVTKIQSGNCIVTQIKNESKDGYWAVQLGFGNRKQKNTTKPLQGHLQKTIKENKFPRFIKEVRLKEEPKFAIGEEINIASILKPGDIVDVVSTSKGKGFAGGVKRHGFAGGPRTHGQSDRERAPGSIGQTTTPGRVYKGKRMAGRMGTETVTLRNLHVISVNPETMEILISGSVPGKVGAFVVINKVKAGSLKDLEKETVVQTVVEGEASEGETKPEENAQKGEENAQG